EVEDLVADGYPGAPLLLRVFAPENAERQVLDRKIAARRVRRLDPALQIGIVRLIQNGDRPHFSHLENRGQSPITRACRCASRCETAPRAFTSSSAARLSRSSHSQKSNPSRSTKRRAWV